MIYNLGDVVHHGKEVIDTKWLMKWQQEYEVAAYNI